MRYTLAAVLAITFLGQAEAGLIAKAPRTETPCAHSSHEVAPTETPSVLSRHILAEPKSTGLPFGGVFVEPDPSDRPTRTTLLSPVSNTTSVSHETPCEDHHTGSAMIHNTTHVKSHKTTPTPTVDLGLEQKFVQTTYWACATLGTEAHCGY